jgi:ribose/xylose/arabinose/galactoside ABC-type transport system permease subunit
MRTLILTLATLLVLVGLFWPIVSKFPLFRLPGDFSFTRRGPEGELVKVYVPISSIIVISLFLSLVLRMVFKR